MTHGRRNLQIKKFALGEACKQLQTYKANSDINDIIEVLHELKTHEHYLQWSEDLRLTPASEALRQKEIALIDVYVRQKLLSIMELEEKITLIPDKNEKEFYDSIFAVLLLLTKFWPHNHYNSEEGLMPAFESPLKKIKIDDQNRLLTSRGFQYVISNKNNGYECEDELALLLRNYNGDNLKNKNNFSLREKNYIIKIAEEKKQEAAFKKRIFGRFFIPNSIFVTTFLLVPLPFLGMGALGAGALLGDAAFIAVAPFIISYAAISLGLAIATFTAALIRYKWEDLKAKWYPEPENNKIDELLKSVEEYATSLQQTSSSDISNTQAEHEHESQTNPTSAFSRSSSTYILREISQDSDNVAQQADHPVNTATFAEQPIEKSAFDQLLTEPQNIQSDERQLDSQMYQFSMQTSSR